MKPVTEDTADFVPTLACSVLAVRFRERRNDENLVFCCCFVLILFNYLFIYLCIYLFIIRNQWTPSQLSLSKVAMEGFLSFFFFFFFSFFFLLFPFSPASSIIFPLVKIQYYHGFSFVILG